TLDLVKPAMTPAAAPAAAVNEGSRSAPRGNRQTCALPISVAPAPAPIVADKGTGSTGAKPTSPSPTAAPVSHTGPSVRRKRDVGGPAKLFVLDTNVLLHDPMSLFRFDEHDIYLPMITLEELDGHKKGMTEVARNARQVSRELDTLATDLSTRQQVDPASGIALAKTGHIEAKGKLYFQTTGLAVEL